MLAIIAGRGALPAVIVGHESPKPLVCALEGFPPTGIEPDRVFRLEHLGTLLNDLRDMGIERVCFAGGISRPAIDPSLIDAATMPLVPVMMKAIGSGDDGALRAVISVFEQAGLSVQAAHDIVPELLPSVGCATETKPDKFAEKDAARGQAIVAALGPADVGQACIVKRNQALAIEGVFGTAWMLQSLKDRPDDPGGLLYKAPKPGQERRADLPLIGPDTVQQAAQAGLDGVVIEAGGVMVLDYEEALKACNRHGLYLWVREAKD